MHVHTRFLKTLFLTVGLTLSLSAENYVLDFSEGDSMDIVFNSEVETRDLGIEYSYALPSGTYEIRLDRGNKFIIPVDRGRLRVENENKKEISKIELITPILNIEEGYALTEAFHKSFNLPLGQFYEWAQPAKEYKFLSDFYGKTFKSNYPTIGMSVHSSYNKDIPFFITYHFGWSNWLHRRRGTSAETNTLKDFIFDVPAVLASVQSNISDRPVTEPTSSDVKQVMEESQSPASRVDNSAKIAATEPSKEEVEQTSDWLLWLIGLMVVIGGFVWILRRKSNDSSQ